MLTDCNRTKSDQAFGARRLGMLLYEVEQESPTLRYELWIVVQTYVYFLGVSAPRTFWWAKKQNHLCHAVTLHGAVWHGNPIRTWSWGRVFLDRWSTTCRTESKKLGARKAVKKRVLRIEKCCVGS